MISAAPQTAVVDLEAQIVRSAAWDQVTPAELSFDFSACSPARRRTQRARRGGDKSSGIKEAIIRWLDEQM